MFTSLDADVDGGEDLLVGYKDRFVDIGAQDLGLEELDGRAVDRHEAFTLAGTGNHSRGLQCYGQPCHVREIRSLNTFFLPNVLMALMVSIMIGV